MDVCICAVPPIRYRVCKLKHFKIKIDVFSELITKMVLRAKRGGPGSLYIIGHYTDRNQNYIVRCVAFSQRQGKFVDVIFGLFTLLSFFPKI